MRIRKTPEKADFPIRSHYLYRTWDGIIQRCTNPNAHQYHNYGGRGINICQRWRLSFLAFLEDMGDRPNGCSLDRIDNNGNYEPTNCRWATHKQQRSNTRESIRERKRHYEALRLPLLDLNLT